MIVTGSIKGSQELTERAPDGQTWNNSDNKVKNTDIRQRCN